MENYKIPFIVKILDKMSPFFFRSKNINYQIVRKILILKLTLDGRRVSNLQAGTNTKNKNNQNKNMQWFSFLMYGIIGLIAAGLQALSNYFVANTLSYGMLMFMILSVYIAEYSDILLDTKEKPFYLVLPITEDELALAKKLHISFYISGIAAVMLLPSVIVGGIVNGVLYSLIYLIMGVLVTLFCVSLTGALYYLLLKLFSGERLKDILNYFQVFMTIAIIVSYQIIPRIIDFAHLDKLDLTGNYAIYLLPSAWYSAIFAILFQNQANLYFTGLLVVGIGMIIGFYLLNRWVIMPQFEKQLSKLEQESTENKALPKWKRKFCKIFSKSEQERAFMELVTIHLSRDRKLKLQIYPQLANAIIIPLIIIIPIVMGGNNTENGLSIMETIRQHPYYFALYFVQISAPSIYYIICQSSTKDTAWIYQALPIDDLRQFIRGGIKVVLGLYLTPIFIALSILFMILYQGKIGLDIFIIYFGFLFYSAVLIRISGWKLPFSQVEQVKTSARKIAIGLLSFLILSLWGAIHYFLIKTLWLQLTALIIMIIANILLWRYGMNKEYVLHRD